MKRLFFYSAIIILSFAILYLLYLIRELHDQINRTEDLQYNLLHEVDNFNSYLNKKFQLEDTDLSIFPLFNLEGKEVQQTDILDQKTLIIVFPASACGICQEEFLEEIKVFMNKNSSQNYWFITDVSSKNEVISYLVDKGLSLDRLYLKKKVYFENLENSGNPYLFLYDTNLQVSHLYIPFSKSQTLSRLYFKMMSRVLHEK